jgi:sulfur-oxidizing protein SoxX
LHIKEAIPKRESRSSSCSLDLTNGLYERNQTMNKLIIFLAGALALLWAGCQPVPKVADPLRLPPGDAARGRATFVELQCWVCHSVAGWKGEPLPHPTIKPSVPVVLGAETIRPTAMERINSIISPSHKIAQTQWPERTTSGSLSKMGDYSDVMTLRQLADVVAFLQALTPDVVVPPPAKK